MQNLPLTGQSIANGVIINMRRNEFNDGVNLKDTMKAYFC